MVHLQRDISWPWLCWMLVQLESSKHLKPGHSEDFRRSYDSRSADQGHCAGEDSYFSLRSLTRPISSIWFVDMSERTKSFYVVLIQHLRKKETSEEWGGNDLLWVIFPSQAEFHLQGKKSRQLCEILFLLMLNSCRVEVFWLASIYPQPNNETHFFLSLGFLGKLFIMAKRNVDNNPS